MRARVGCEFHYESAGPSPAIILVQPRLDIEPRLLREEWRVEPASALHGFTDLYGNRLQRLTLPTGPISLIYDGLVEIDDEPEPVVPTAVQHLVENLPDDVLIYTLASRYCLSDALSDTAWRLFGDTPPGWARVQAVCDWVHANIRYGVPSTPLTTALDIYECAGGMCRDFAHLAITFCRSLNIPARYVFGYLPDVGVAPPYPPMDFHAWFEVYLDGRWWAFDARFNTPRIGRIPIGRGRDAVDVAMVTTYGPARFKSMTVWSDVVTEDGTVIPPADLVDMKGKTVGTGRA